MPAWLEKWTALILEFVQEEQRLLPEQLLALPSHIAAYTPFTAASEAKGELACSRVRMVSLNGCSLPSPEQIALQSACES